MPLVSSRSASSYPGGRSTRPVRRTMGTSGLSRFISDASSAPVRSGSRWSVMTRSTWLQPNSFRALLPLVAVRTQYPAMDKRSRRAVSPVVSSSTHRITRTFDKAVLFQHPTGGNRVAHPEFVIFWNGRQIQSSARSRHEVRRTAKGERRPSTAHRRISREVSQSRSQGYDSSCCLLNNEDDMWFWSSRCRQAIPSLLGGNDEVARRCRKALRVRATEGVPDGEA